MLYDIDKVRKAIVALVIENSLLENGKPFFDDIIRILKKEYNCYLPDCYEHPEYLREVLKSYGKANKVIVESIKKQLDEFSYQGPIARFLKVITS